MKSVVSLFISIVFAFGLTACGGTSQDPLEKQSELVKGGEVPSKPKPPKEKPLAQDVLRIDGADFFVFRENVEQEISIKARSGFNEALYTIEVTNMDSFKNATMTTIEGDVAKDQQAQVNFKWTPPKGMVFADVITYQLETMVYTTNLAENYSFKKTFNIFIYKETFSVPEIISVTSLPAAIKENTTAQFKVKVKDVDGTETTLPSLLALTDYTQKNGAPYVSWGKAVQDVNDPQMWWFDVTINLKDVDLTTGADNAEFSLSALSAAGKKSNPYKLNFTVWSSVLKPVTSWMDAVEFKIGQGNHFDFTIVDPRGEGKLTAKFLTNCSTLAGAPTCVCIPRVGIAGKADTLMSCSIDWMVPTGTPTQEQVIVFNAQNKSTLPGDTQMENANFSGKIKLVP